MKRDAKKTNVMRLLEQVGVDYVSHIYLDSDAVGGMEVADFLGENPSQTFKTLVTVGHSKEHFVFLVPVNKELDLKKAANSVNEKNVEMLKSKELLPLTGYIHGGCSPIGMKKQFVTVIDESAKNFDTIMFSGGKIGYQVEVKVGDLNKALDFSFADISK